MKIPRKLTQNNKGIWNLRFLNNKWVVNLKSRTFRARFPTGSFALLVPVFTSNEIVRFPLNAFPAYSQCLIGECNILLPLNFSVKYTI